jgi:hypothetical protein
VVELLRRILQQPPCRRRFLSRPLLPPPPPVMRFWYIFFYSGLTLHGALEVVLRKAGRPLKFGELRTRVIQQNLYQEGDGSDVSHQQVRARVSHYPRIFRIDRSKDPQEVSLLEWDNQ